MKVLLAIPFACALSRTATNGEAPSAPVPVTVDNFNRAESDMYFRVAATEAGGTGKLFHRREAVSVDKQPVVRANRDTLYSSGVFDLGAGPVTITMPAAAQRFVGCWFCWLRPDYAV